jgi:hypothetical protein
MSANADEDSRGSAVHASGEFREGSGLGSAVLSPTASRKRASAEGILSRSFSKAPTLAVSFFISAAMASSCESLIIASYQEALSKAKAPNAAWQLGQQGDLCREPRRRR